MVGENIFTTLSLDDDGLVSETPEPSNILTVQPGDVVGYYTISRQDMEDGIQLDNDDSQRTDSVWYHTGTDSELFNVGIQNNNCPFPVGTEPDKY